LNRSYLDAARIDSEAIVIRRCVEVAMHTAEIGKVGAATGYRI
jgi:hypothetical protein